MNNISKQGRLHKNHHRMNSILILFIALDQCTISNSFITSFNKLKIIHHPNHNKITFGIKSQENNREQKLKSLYNRNNIKNVTISLKDAIQKAKALPISRLRNALDRRGIEYDSNATKEELQKLYANALFNNIPLKPYSNRITISNIVDVSEDVNNKVESKPRPIRQKPKYDVSKINNRYKVNDPILNDKHTKQIKKYIDKTKDIAKTSTKILFVKGAELLRNYNDVNFQWKNTVDYSKQNRVRINRKQTKSSSKLLLPPCATPTFPLSSSESSETSQSTDDVVKVYNTTKYYRKKRRRQRNTRITQHINIPTTSTQDKKQVNQKEQKTKKKRIYWKDKLNEQIDYAFGLHIDEEYDKWIKQKEVDDANKKILQKAINPKKRLDTKKAFWDDEGSILQLLFGRIPKHQKSPKRKLKKFFKNYEDNVDIMTMLFKVIFQNLLVSIAYISRWASVRNALPQPIIVLALVTSILCAPRGKRMLTVGITLICCRTVAEALHGYIYDDWDDESVDEGESDDVASLNGV